MSSWLPKRTSNQTVKPQNRDRALDRIRRELVALTANSPGAKNHPVAAIPQLALVGERWESLCEAINGLWPAKKDEGAGADLARELLDAPTTTGVGGTDGR